MRRVSVVGNAGAGKTTLAIRLARVLQVPHIELDAIHHLAGWQAIDPEAFTAEVARLTSQDGWVIDGNYRAVVMDGPVWARADTVVWLDLPRSTVTARVARRTVRRAVTRAELWNGNREPLANFYAWDPYRSIIRWAWTRHGEYRARYGEASLSPEFGHLSFVRLRNRREIEEWMAGVTR